MRAAIIGLFNSGSSVISQIVEKLGADIGRPLWGDHFESSALRAKLISWWNEPELVETVDQCERVSYLRLWAEYHEASSPIVCAKHPLLCLSAPDLDLAWGGDYAAIRAVRPLDESIRRLERRNWFNSPVRMQNILHEASEKYFLYKRDYLSIEYEKLCYDPFRETVRIAEFLKLNVSDKVIMSASLVVRRKEKNH